MPIEEADVDVLMLFLSRERLGNLHRLTGNWRAAIELHQMTLRLGTDLMTLIAVIEIALRNSICENLAQFFGQPDWLLNPPLPFKWKDKDKRKIQEARKNAQRAEYSKLSQAEKADLDRLAFPGGPPADLSHSDRSRERQRQIPVTDGKIIAELTFYIWKRLCGPDYEHTLWRPVLKKSFPNKRVKRSDVAENLEIIYQARNRLAHHEPVLHKRFADTVSAVRYISQHLGARFPSDATPLYRLIVEDIERIEENAKILHRILDDYRM
ncbi:Abi-like protein [Agrobacterium vitis]|nr:Abi-like protein [Agrobacterium vitis]